MNNILIVYYSRHGGTQALAEAIATGVEQNNANAIVRTVPPVSAEHEKCGESIPSQGPPFVTKQDLLQCDGLVLGSPTRFGNMAAPVKYFLDSTSDEWLKGSLSGKPASVFTASSSLHGGQESTLLSMMLPLFHHGMLICGLPYSESALHSTATGGTPYGVTHVSGNEAKPLSTEEKQLAVAQGKRMAQFAQALTGAS